LTRNAIAGTRAERRPAGGVIPIGGRVGLDGRGTVANGTAQALGHAGDPVAVGAAGWR
jgi:hypothetical protein